MAGQQAPQFATYDQERYSAEIEDAMSFVGQGHEHFTQVKARRLVDLARRRIGDPAGLTALDVGCGTGETDRFLASHFGRLNGVDVAGPPVQIATRENPTVDYQVYDGRRLPFDDDAVDLSFAICVVHHVPPPDWRDFVAEMGRVTRPGGLVAIFEHNPLNPLTRRVVNRCCYDETAELLRRRVAARQLRAAGLEVAEQAYILFSPFGGESITRLERPLGWLPLGAQYYVAGRVR